jgi:hypothetical protein
MIGPDSGRGRELPVGGAAFDRDYVDHGATEWAVEDRWRGALSWRA